jgi:hypothetical protein
MWWDNPLKILVEGGIAQYIDGRTMEFIPLRYIVPTKYVGPKRPQLGGD